MVGHDRGLSRRDGVNDISLKWFWSYLTGRQRYVEIDGYSSGLLPLTTGVPQGSILGPLLFLIYMNDIPHATDYFDFILYADDASHCSKIQAPVTSPIDINDELSGVYNWLAVNKLSLNIKKIKYMIFHPINKKYWWLSHTSTNRQDTHRKGE